MDLIFLQWGVWGGGYILDFLTSFNSHFELLRGFNELYFLYWTIPIQCWRFIVFLYAISILILFHFFALVWHYFKTIYFFDWNLCLAEVLISFYIFFSFFLGKCTIIQIWHIVLTYLCIQYQISIHILLQILKYMAI